ncbi:MAG: sigma-70 family RNA polymerase sigma factor [Planctomycetes bacterium]|nr:sigma-70 family RNA polymerase sigma factor [Planctomycetota bacterium]
MSAPRLDPAALLEHRDYVKRLARKLVFDAALAEDVEQEVWAIALARPPRDASALKAWLATVARNTVRLAARSSSRRGAREREVARSESVSAADELVDREALRKDLIDAVLALDEPYRETVILRYVDELPPREIAARTGAHVEAVKSRLKRGLELLRARLDRRFGSRASWCLALTGRLELAPSSAALALHSFGSVSTAFALMSTTKKLSLAVLVVAALAVIVPWRIDAAEVVPGAPRAETSEFAEVAPAPREDSRAAVATEPATASAAPLAAPTARSVETGVLEVLAQWSDDHTPIAGLWVTLRASASSPSFEPRSARTDADGLARFEDVPTGDVQLETDRGGQDFGLVRADKVRRKTLSLERGVAVEGRVLDLAGEPVADAEIWLTRYPDFVDGFPVTKSGADGRYSIVGVRAGERYIGAREPRHAPSGSHSIYANPGATLSLDLVLGGPASSIAGHVLDVQGRPIVNALVVVGPKDAPEIVRPDGTVFLTPDGCATRTDATGRFELRGLLAGESWVEARAAGFLVASARVVLPADGWAESELTLERGATLIGSVRLANGGPARQALVTAKSTLDHEQHSTTTELDGSFRFDGLRPGATALHAEWGDQEWRDATLELVAQETRWDVVLEQGRELVGRVLDETGAPAAGLRVELERGSRDDEPFLRAAKTDLDGRFRLRGVAERDHVLRVFAEGSGLFALGEFTGVRPSDQELVVRLDAASRPSVRIVGRVITPDGDTPAGTTIMPFNEALGWAVHQLVAADGTFSIGPLPAGDWGFVLEAEGFAAHGVPARTLARDAVWDVGTVTLARGDALTVRYALPEGATREPVLVAEGLDAPISEWLTVERGVARSKPLPPGRYRVRVEMTSELAADFRDVELVAGRGAELEFAFTRGVELVVRTHEDAGGERARHGRLTIFDAAGRAVVERPLSPRESGAFEFPLCLAPGSYRYLATYDDGKTAAAGFEVSAGSPSSVLDVTME